MGKRRILCVEDNEALADVMHTFLESKGFQVLAAGTGADAVKIAQEELPDLILMDLQLPVMSGLEATRRIRAMAELATIPIIAVTGFATEFDTVRTRTAGCDAHIAKPYDLDNLLETITGLLP